jgi:hypothetical protein
MSEHQESVGSLEAFRSEIQRIVDRLRHVDGTLQKITDVKELDNDALAIWNNLKNIIRDISQLDVNMNNKEVQKNFDYLLERSRKLANDTKNLAESNAAQSKNSACEFYAWINNRIPIGQIQLALETLVDSGSAKSAVEDLQDLSKTSIDLLAGKDAAA